MTNLDVSLKTINVYNNLSQLFCYHNNLTTIDLSLLPNLEIIDCSYNNLTSLDFSCHHNLRNVYCQHNLLTNLNICQSNLRILDASHNMLTSINLSPVNYCEQLILHHNNLSQIDIVESCYKLQKLDIHHNNLVTLPEGIIELQDITYINYSHNLLQLSLAQQAFFNILRQGLLKSLVHDSQNIHDSSIVTSAKISLIKIINTYKISENIEDLPDIQNISVNNIIQKYCSNTSRFEYDTCQFITFSQLLAILYPLVVKYNLQDIFVDEMLASQSLCFTGIIIRLLNVFNGIIPEVNITISKDHDITMMASYISSLSLSSNDKQEKFVMLVKHKYPEITLENLFRWLSYL